jgi:spore maturation protein CgeB
MKLLIYRYGSICEPDIIAAFQMFGFDVSEIRHEVYHKDGALDESIRLVSNYLLDHPVDAVFTINFFPFLSEVCNIFHIPYLSWIVDSPVMELYATSITHPYNRVFLFDRCTYEEIHPLNPDCVFHLPLAVNCEDKQKVIRGASSAQRKNFSADVSFVGSLYTEKNPYSRFRTRDQRLLGYLEGLMEAQKKVYGYFFLEECLTDEVVEAFKKDFPGFYHYPAETFLTDRTTLAQLYLGTNVSVLERQEVFDRLSRRFSVDLYTGSDTSGLPRVHNCGFAKSLEEMPIIFYHSQINLNITAKSIRSGIPQRIFDILGCEGFLISNYQSEIGDYFEAGTDLELYSSMEELEEKTAYYLEHPSLCREIAHNAYEKVRTYHTYPVRLTQMFEMAFGQKGNV